MNLEQAIAIVKPHTDKVIAEGRIETLERENAALYSKIRLMNAALEQCEEYFDNRADADCDQDGFIPNTEMKLLCEVREALGKGGH